jgi:F-type H+-transporting ATPase subunit a
VESPLLQFKVHPYLQIIVGGVDLSITNATVWMAIIVLAVYWLVMAGTRSRALVPGRLQSMVELIYEFTVDMVGSNIGKQGLPYFPAIFTLFMFVLLANMLALLPGGFSVTAQIIVNFVMAMCVVVGATILGFWLHGLGFLKFFVPSGAPLALMPLLVPIELISYCFRPISLSVRLFANMMAGHAMLHVFAAFAVMLGLIFGIGPLALTVALYALEILVALLQAYVFAILSCIYINDAIHLH